MSTAPRYLVETVSGKPVYTTGTKITLDVTERRVQPFGDEAEMESYRRIYEARLGEPIRFIPDGLQKFMSI